MKNASIIKKTFIAGLMIILFLSLTGCGSGGSGLLEPFRQTDPEPGPLPPDNIPPAVLSTVPVTQSTGIKINSKISVKFTENMKESSVNSATFLLRDASNNPVAGTAVCNGSVATFTPNSYLSTNSIYTATITNAVTDLLGNHLSNNYTWSFRTSSSTDVTPPTVVSTNPASNAVEVRVASPLTIVFSEPMDPTTVTSAAVTLRDNNYNLISGTVSCNANTATLTPLTDLSPKAHYTACITTAVMDLAENALANDYCWDFMTGFANSELFSPYIAFPTDSMPQAVAIGDVTGDGKNDVVMVTGAYLTANDYKLFLFAQNSMGGLSPAASFTTTGTYGNSPHTVAIGDINNDGKNEVIVGNSGMNIEVFVQDGQGGLVSDTTYSTVNSTLIKIADLNHDGRPDVVGIGWGTNTVDVFLQNANGTLDPPVTYAIEHAGWDDLEVGDVNNDGFVDIVVMSGQGLTPRIGVLIQKTDGTFSPAVYYTPAGASIGVGDVNGDGLHDVVVTAGGVCVLTQNNIGSLNPNVCYPSSGSGALEVADVNQDGRRDVIMVHYGGNAIGLYLQAANGSLMSEELYTIPYGVNNPHSLAIGDINSDGINDIITLDMGKGLIVLYHK